MASTTATIAEAVKTAIVTKKEASGFVFNNFEIARTWLPYQLLKDIPAGGKVWVIGLTADDQQTESRGNTCKREFPIQVAFQKRVSNPIDATEIDPLVELVEQLRDVCREEVDTGGDYSWQRNEPLTDENETPYSYLGLREGLFEAVFTAYYLKILS